MPPCPASLYFPGWPWIHKLCSAPRVLDLQVRPYSLLENRVTGASNAPKQEFLMENGLAFQQFLTLLASLIIALLPTDFFLLGFGREFSPPSLLSRGRHQFWSSLCLDRLTIKLPHLLTTAHHSLQWNQAYLKLYNLPRSEVTITIVSVLPNPTTFDLVKHCLVSQAFS